ncbi:MAG: class I SAM-dependent methyltransferase, partial [Kiritimatiellae bacterium]|nr:class I SAM-dependent methyltransferase [Kiritimatiellia bacterium]
GGWASALLRERGGEWTSLERPGVALETLRFLCEDRCVAAWEPAAPLPFEEQHFDVVVWISGFEEVAEPATAVRECHRVLKPAGRLVVNVPFATRVAPLRWLGLGGEMRAGYTVARLYDVLKDGFDLQECRRYGRLMMELADRLARRAARRRAEQDAAGRPDPITLCRAQAVVWRRWAWPTWWLTQLDALLFLSPGYRLIARARRRLWIPRRAPVLADGRSVAEAALGGRIGSASAWTPPGG